MSVQSLLLANSPPWKFIAAGAKANGANPSVAVPAGIITGDLLILATCSGLSAATPAGWTAIMSAGSGGARISAFYKFASASESSVSISSVDTKGVSVMIAYRSITAIDVAGTASSNGGGTTIATNSLTTTIVNDLVISIFGQTQNAGTWTAPASTTTRFDSASDGTYSGLLIVDENKVTAGATTDRTATTTASGSQKSAQAASFKQ